MKIEKQKNEDIKTFVSRIREDVKRGKLSWMKKAEGSGRRFAKVMKKWEAAE